MLVSFFYFHLQWSQLPGGRGQRLGPSPNQAYFFLIPCLLTFWHEWSTEGPSPLKRIWSHITIKGEDMSILFLQLLHDRVCQKHISFILNIIRGISFGFGIQNMGEFWKILFSSDLGTPKNGFNPLEGKKNAQTYIMWVLYTCVTRSWVQGYYFFLLNAPGLRKHPKSHQIIWLSKRDFFFFLFWTFSQPRVAG